MNYLKNNSWFLLFLIIILGAGIFALWRGYFYITRWLKYNMEWLKNNGWFLFFLLIIFGAGWTAWELSQFYELKFGALFPTDVSDATGRGSWGALGDFFGGMLNPFFAFLGLLMLLLTLHQNQKALYLSREELALSRKELEGSKEALKDQAETLEKQRFEDTFFALLDQHNIILNRANESDSSSSNQSTIKKLYNRLVRTNSFVTLKDTKKEFLLLNNTDQYFRVLYQLLKLIASDCPKSTLESNFSREKLATTTASSEEKKYSNIVRSFLPDKMYYLLAINCYCEKEQEDLFYEYRQLVERYSMLEHMPLVFDKKDNEPKPILKEILEHYDKTAFGDNKDYRELIQQLSTPEA